MSAPNAVVVGLCGHGLAIARALAGAGIRVFALEANRSLPGFATSAAEKILVEDINGAGLIESLALLAKTLRSPPVLFLTNDRMVETVGAHHGSLAADYRLSWATSRSRLLPLLKKETVYRRCAEIGMAHPKTVTIRGGQDFGDQIAHLRLPVIVKPDRPISSYKTLILESKNQIGRSLPIISTALPAVVQEFIPGDDSQIYFAALFLDRGRVLARYEGRKLRSRPMGHTTIALGESNDETHCLAKQFFSGLDLSGPVSLELKSDPTGAFWVIEPTVGRTDFWIGLCIHDGLNLPEIEYRYAAGESSTVGTQQNSTLWINEERDPGAPLWLLKNHPLILLRKRRVWLYFWSRDYRPFVRWLFAQLINMPIRIFNKIRRSMSSGSRLRRA